MNWNWMENLRDVQIRKNCKLCIFTDQNFIKYTSDNLCFTMVFKSHSHTSMNGIFLHIEMDLSLMMWISTLISYLHKNFKWKLPLNTEWYNVRYWMVQCEDCNFYVWLSFIFSQTFPYLIEWNCFIHRNGCFSYDVDFNLYQVSFTKISNGYYLWILNGTMYIEYWFLCVVIIHIFGNIPIPHGLKNFNTSQWIFLSYDVHFNVYHVSLWKFSNGNYLSILNGIMYRILKTVICKCALSFIFSQTLVSFITNILHLNLHLISRYWNSFKQCKFDTVDNRFQYFQGNSLTQ